MGKTIRAQRIGKVGRKATGHRNKGAAEHIPLKESKNNLVKGKVTDLFHDPGRTAPMARVGYENGTKQNIIAANNLGIGDEVAYGINAPIKVGSTLYISDIPEGTLVYNVEATPGDNGKFGRSSGTFIRVATHDVKNTVVQMPSGSFKTLNSKCRATIGVVAGGGRKEKPWVKAGSKHYAKKARGRTDPWVCGVNMNPTDHPHGGGNHPHIGKPATVSRHTPPGRKVGSIAARRKGKKR